MIFDRLDVQSSSKNRQEIGWLAVFAGHPMA
jgi:hypothetical protein